MPDRNPSAKRKVAAGRVGRSGRCPICGAPTRRELRPFCSRRCADLDLGRWLRGAYRIPTQEAPREAAEGDEGPDGDDGQ